MRSSRPRAGNYDFFGEDAGGYTPSARAMAIPGATPESAVPVSALTETAKAIIEGAIAPIWVRGEVTDFKRHRNGHWYFSLRDASAQVRCVVWARDQRGIPASPDDGMEVLAYGRMTVYAARGDLHLTVTRLEARGDGLWRKALEETRARLERDGLLAAERKRPLPFAPNRIAVVTSPDGAAIRDIIAVVRRRAPYVQIVVSATKVQGEGAPEEICAAIARVTKWGGADLMIVGRGGGAREDLWAFNDERVARAIAAAPIPVISAVGHEVDVTVADLVADYRAPTPSAAAEAAVPVRDELMARLNGDRAALVHALERRVRYAREALVGAARTINLGATRHVERRTAAVREVAGRLEALSPLATLSRGYAVARHPETGQTLSHAADFKAGMPFQLIVQDGTVTAETRTVRPAESEES